MPERRDFLAVCNDQGVPLVDFQATFCVRCVQPECSRSRAAGLFETRVATWQERLFDNPPRMPKDDPLYALLSAKRFIEVDVGRVPNVRGPSEWLDPRALEESTPVEAPRPARPPRPGPAEVSVPAPEGGPAPRVEGTPLGHRAPLNTPFVQGTMLAGTPAQPAAADAWAAGTSAVLATETPPSAPIVKAGARIKFTGA